MLKNARCLISIGLVRGLSPLLIFSITAEFDFFIVLLYQIVGTFAAGAAHMLYAVAITILLDDLDP